MTLQMLGVNVVPLPVSIENGFIPKVEHAEVLVTVRTRAIVLVSPNNPVSTPPPTP
jgi:aspartate/methionine/tyrosine aminotransferase